MSDSQGIRISKPISVWNRPLKANFNDLFKSLTKVVAQGAISNWSGAAKDATDALSAIGLERDAGQIAWLLIYRSIARATFKLIEENFDLIRVNSSLFSNYPAEAELSKDNAQAILRKLDLSLEESELTIDDEFFRHPSKLQLLDDIKLPLTQWLIELGLTAAQANSISDRLPAYFVYALNNEWRINQKDYLVLTETLNTPFTKASEREQAWSRYSAWLQKQIEEPLFYEAFSLNRVYIPLRAYFESYVQREKYLTVIDLREALQEWLNQNDAQDSIRVISGGPGSGKSSFAKVFAAETAALPSNKVLFVPLHRFDLTDDLIEAVNDFVRNEGFLPHNPVDPKDGDHQLLIIFDGLDELSMMGKAAFEVAQKFIYEVQRKLDQLNIREARLKVLLTGREIAIQSHINNFRKSRQILYMLPYSIHKRDLMELRRENRYARDVIDKKNLLKQDQRELWWKAYGEVTGYGYETIPADLKRGGLNDITTQPLLNYLVALSFVRGKLDFKRDNSLNIIYDDLLQSVYQRVWSGYQHPALQGISQEDFFRILEEIAISTWHGDGRTTSIREVEERCSSCGTSLLLEKFKEGAKEGLTRLLMAFYFRKTGNRATGDETFEFTHKSFGEYLTSRRIVRTIQVIQDELERRKRSYDSGWDEKYGLRHWIELCGPARMDHYTLNFLQREICLHPIQVIEGWQHTLAHLLTFTLHHGIPLEKLEPRLTFKEELRQASNAEEALLASLSACSQRTQKVSEISHPSLTAFSDLLSRIHGQRIGPVPSLSHACLNNLNLSRCVLNFKDLKSVNMASCILVGTQFVEANLKEANLQSADLRKANLQNANLQNANLQFANFEDADVKGASIYKANLHGANLRRADMHWVNLEGANMTSTELEEAHFGGANLQGASLQKANLLRTGLNAANLTRANLEGATCKQIHISELTILNHAKWIDGRMITKVIYKLKSEEFVFENSEDDLQSNDEPDEKAESQPS